MTAFVFRFNDQSELGEGHERYYSTGESRGIYLSQPYCIAYIAESESYLSSIIGIIITERKS